MITIRRVYDHIDSHNEAAILVDRLWPRGISKEKIKIDLWIKDIAPSDKLRQWFSHDAKKWEQFKDRYKEEIMKDASKLALANKTNRKGTRECHIALFC